MIMHSFILVLSALSAAVLARPQNGPVFPDPVYCDCDVRTKTNLIQNPNFGKDSWSSITIPIGQNPPASWYAPHSYEYQNGLFVKTRNDAISWQTKTFLTTTHAAGFPRTLQQFVEGSSSPGDKLTGPYKSDYLAQNFDTRGQGNGKPGGCACLSFEVGVYVEGLSEVNAAIKKVWNYVDDAWINYSVGHSEGLGFLFKGKLRYQEGGDLVKYSIGSNAPLWPNQPQVPRGLGGFPGGGIQFSGIPQGKWTLNFETGIRKKPGVKPVWLLIDNVKLAWGDVSTKPVPP